MLVSEACIVHPRRPEQQKLLARVRFQTLPHLPSWRFHLIKAPKRELQSKSKAETSNRLVIMMMVMAMVMIDR